MLKSEQIKLGTLIDYKGIIYRVVGDARHVSANPFVTEKWDLVIREYDPIADSFGETLKLVEEDILESATLFNPVEN